MALLANQKRQKDAKIEKKRAETVYYQTANRNSKIAIIISIAALIVAIATFLFQFILHH